MYNVYMVDVFFTVQVKSGGEGRWGLVLRILVSLTVFQQGRTERNIFSHQGII